MPYKNWRTFTINANCHQQDMSSKTLTNFISEKGVTFSKRQICSCSHKRHDFQVTFKKREYSLPLLKFHPAKLNWKRLTLSIYMFKLKKTRFQKPNLRSRHTAP